MKNLNIYTLRELIKMYIDEKPMPDVAFVTQTDAMKLQSTLKKETMSEWITDRLPDVAECTNEGDVWVYLEDVDEYVIRNQSQIDIGDPWREIDPPPSYVKPKRYYVDFAHDTWNVWRSKNPLQLVNTNVATHIPTREAAERIAAIYEEVMP